MGLLGLRAELYALPIFGLCFIADRLFPTGYEGTGMWWPVVAAVVGAAGSYLASREANKKTAEQRRMEGILGQNAQTGQRYGNEALAQGTQLQQQGIRQQQRLATGTRQDVLQELAPQLSMQDRMRRSAMSIDAALAPRSGVSAERRLGMRDDALADRNNAIMGITSQARNNLGMLGSEQVAQGMGFLGMGAQGANASLGWQRNNRNDAYQQSRDAGNSFFQMMEYLKPYMQQGGQGYNQASSWGQIAGNASGSAAQSVINGWGR